MSPVQAARAFESAMGDVTKVVDFPTPQAFKDFQAALVEMSKTVPLSVNGLAQIAAAAGQAGIAGDDLIPFTEAAAKIGVAFDISADQAGEALAKLRTALGLSTPEAVLLTDAMNELSNAQASSAAEILDVVRRVGAGHRLVAGPRRRPPEDRREHRVGHRREPVTQGDRWRRDDHGPAPHLAVGR